MLWIAELWQATLDQMFLLQRGRGISPRITAVWISALQLGQLLQ